MFYSTFRSFFFFFNDTATTEIYTLSLHDALPISPSCMASMPLKGSMRQPKLEALQPPSTGGIVGMSFFFTDRKSTRLNSSHGYISYAVFCLKKKKKQTDLGVQGHLDAQRLCYWMQ